MISIGEKLLSEFELLPDRTKQLFISAVASLRFDWKLFFELYDFSDFTCDSPIESIFYMTLCLVNLDNGFPVSSIEKQKKIFANGNFYIVDFYIEHHTGTTVIVECDGHDFHEKTKEQVEYGNNRDYDLKTEGYDILHFTGSQIYNKPIQCCYKIINYLESKAGV